MRATVLLKSKTDTLFGHHHQALTAAVLNKSVLQILSWRTVSIMMPTSPNPNSSRLMGLQHGKDCLVSRACNFRNWLAC